MAPAIKLNRRYKVRGAVTVFSADGFDSADVCVICCCSALSAALHYKRVAKYCSTSPWFTYAVPLGLHTHAVTHVVVKIEAKTKKGNENWLPGC